MYEGHDASWFLVARQELQSVETKGSGKIPVSLEFTWDGGPQACGS